MKQFLSKIWQAVKYSIKWILIQYAVIFFALLLVYVYSLTSDLGFWDILSRHFSEDYRIYVVISCFLFAIPMYTIPLSFWHAFFNKKEHWWTVVIPWVVLYISYYLFYRTHTQHDPSPFTFGQLVGWLSPLYGALLQGIIIFFRKKAAKIQEQEYQEMISSVQGMFDRVILTRDDVEKHIREVTEEELANLINISKSIPPEEHGPGYYIPSDRNFITHSLEKRPDQVYLLNRIEPLILKENNNDDYLFSSSLDVENMNKDLYVFLFDNFGFPETHLCARRGYVLYDTDKKDIVAYHWTWIS